MVVKKCSKKLLAAFLCTNALWGGYSVYAEENLKEFSLDTMIVTATATPVDSIMKANAAVNIITREDIQAKHYRNLQEILEHIPGYNGFMNANGVGFEVSNYTTPSMRGTRKTVVLIDGVKQDMGGRFYSAAAARNVNDIERIEVVKGTSSTLYGAEAIGGVINIITRSHYDKPETKLSVSAGNFSTQNYQVDNYGELGKSFWSFSVLRRHQGDYKDGNGRTRPQDVNVTEFDLKYGYHLSDTSDLVLKYVNHDQDQTYVEGRGGGWDVPGNGIYRYNTTTAILNSKDADGKWGNSFSMYRGSMLNDRALANYKINALGETISSSAWAEKSKNTTWSITDRYWNQLDSRNRLSAGVDINSNTFEGLQKQYSSNPKGKFTLKEKSIYVQDEWNITDKLKFTAGVRYANSDNAESRWLPSFDLGYNFSDKAMMYVSRKDYMSYPSPYQMTGWDASTFTYLPAYGLKPYTGTTNEIGAKFRFDDSTYFDIAYYDRRENDSITLNTIVKADSANGIKGYGYYQNLENPMHYKGIEINLVKDFGEHLTTTLGYNHLSCDREDLISNMAGDTFDVDVKYKNLNYNVGISGIGRYDIARTSTLISNNYRKSPDSWVWNVYGNYDVNKTTKVWAVVNNVFDKFYEFYPEWDSTYKEPRYYSKPGRSFLIGVEYTF